MCACVCSLSKNERRSCRLSDRVAFLSHFPRLNTIAVGDPVGPTSAVRTFSFFCADFHTLIPDMQDGPMVTFMQGGWRINGINGFLFGLLSWDESCQAAKMSHDQGPKQHERPGTVLRCCWTHFGRMTPLFPAVRMPVQKCSGAG